MLLHLTIIWNFSTYTYFKDSIVVGKLTADSNRMFGIQELHTFSCLLGVLRDSRAASLPTCIISLFLFVSSASFSIQLYIFCKIPSQTSSVPWAPQHFISVFSEGLSYIQKNETSISNLQSGMNFKADFKLLHIFLPFYLNCNVLGTAFLSEALKLINWF